MQVPETDISHHVERDDQSVSPAPQGRGPAGARDLAASSHEDKRDVPSEHLSYAPKQYQNQQEVEADTDLSWEEKEEFAKSFQDDDEEAKRQRNSSSAGKRDKDGKRLPMERTEPYSDGRTLRNCDRPPLKRATPRMDAFLKANPSASNEEGYQRHVYNADPDEQRFLEERRAQDHRPKGSGKREYEETRNSKGDYDDRSRHYDIRNKKHPKYNQSDPIHEQNKRAKGSGKSEWERAEYEAENYTKGRGKGDAKHKDNWSQRKWTSSDWNQSSWDEHGSSNDENYHHPDRVKKRSWEQQKQKQHDDGWQSGPDEDNQVWRSANQRWWKPEHNQRR